MAQKIAVYRKEHFNAAHRLHNPALSDSENALIFGKCNYANYHGHNYDLVVKVTGEINPETGYVFDLKELKEITEEYIIKRYDHRNLNLDVIEFAKTIPSAENIAVSIWNILRSKIDKAFDIRVVLYETERNFVEYSGN